MTEGNWLALIVGILAFIFALCLSVSLGLLVAPWLGFLVASAFAMAAIIVVLVSYKNAHRESQ